VDFNQTQKQKQRENKRKNKRYLRGKNGLASETRQGGGREMKEDRRRKQEKKGVNTHR
jgi:hypothetical protein